MPPSGPSLGSGVRHCRHSIYLHLRRRDSMLYRYRPRSRGRTLLERAATGACVACGLSTALVWEGSPVRQITAHLRSHQQTCQRTLGRSRGCAVDAPTFVMPGVRGPATLCPRASGSSSISGPAPRRGGVERVASSFVPPSPRRWAPRHRAGRRFARRRPTRWGSAQGLPSIGRR